MNVVAQIAVVLVSLVHVLIFAMESVLFTRVQVYRRFRTRAEDVATVRQWAFNQGWYNLFLAAGAIGGHRHSRRERHDGTLDRPVLLRLHARRSAGAGLLGPADAARGSHARSPAARGAAGRDHILKPVPYDFEDHT